MTTTTTLANVAAACAVALCGGLLAAVLSVRASVPSEDVPAPAPAPAWTTIEAEDVPAPMPPRAGSYHHRAATGRKVVKHPVVSTGHQVRYTELEQGGRPGAEFVKRID